MSKPLRARGAALQPGGCGLLVVDLQEGFCRRGQGAFANPPAKWTTARLDAYFGALQPALANAGRLAQAFRSAGAEVLFTVIESLTRDGRDRSLDHKLSDLHVPKGSPDACVVTELYRGSDEIVLPKTASGVFNATAIDYVLRNLGIEQLVICGVFTDQCVESAVRDASDRGYYVTLAGDACAGTTPAAHANTLAAMAAYGRVATTDELLAELVARAAA